MKKDFLVPGQLPHAVMELLKDHSPFWLTYVEAAEELGSEPRRTANTLGDLRRRGLIEGEKKGRRTYWRVRLSDD